MQLTHYQWNMPSVQFAGTPITELKLTKNVLSARHLKKNLPLFNC